MHKIWKINVYIYVMTQYITIWNIGWMVKELVCVRGDEGSNSLLWHYIFGPKWL